MSNCRVILVFLKWPEPGKVKTRLGSEIGLDAAAGIYRTLAERVVEIASTVPTDEIRLLLDPPDREADIRAWLESRLADRTSKSVRFVAQSPGDLGDRLSTAFAGVFDEYPAAHAAAIGTDCIEIDERTFSQTWKELATGKDLVIGPATDGGYYLIGLSSPQPVLFEEIPWSQPETFEATLTAARSAGLAFSLLEKRRDIDTLEDWERAKLHLPSDTT